jgi:hypothetical protein
MPEGHSQQRQATQGLFGGWQDGLLLGGASIGAFAGLQLVPLTDSWLTAIATLMLGLAHLVNHPHFAHSYQMFYGGWSRTQDPAFDLALRRKWWLVGAVVPAALACILTSAYWSAINGDPTWIGACLSLMALLVGWHYVKQGFGMVMLDAALRQRFFDVAQKKSLLINAYACWLCAWMLIADLHSNTILFGYARFGFDIPDSAVIAACVLAAMTTCHASLSIQRAVKRWQEQGAGWGDLPAAGILAYYVTLYLWTVFSWVNPAYALVIPFFHSLQYLTVVWRYKRSELAVQGPLWRSWPCVRFLLAGIALGMAGFWVVPGTLEWARTGHLLPSMRHLAPAMACAWILINVHHYFIDSVLWRQGNPDVSRHLFKKCPADGRRQAGGAGSGLNTVRLEETREPLSR